MLLFRPQWRVHLRRSRHYAGNHSISAQLRPVSKPLARWQMQSLALFGSTFQSRRASTTIWIQFEDNDG